MTDIMTRLLDGQYSYQFVAGEEIILFSKML